MSQIQRAFVVGAFQMRRGACMDGLVAIDICISSLIISRSSVIGEILSEAKDDKVKDGIASLRPLQGSLA